MTTTHAKKIECWVCQGTESINAPVGKSLRSARTTCPWCLDKAHQKKIEGRTICARCGWRKADHGIVMRLFGAMSCWRFRGAA